MLWVLILVPIGCSTHLHRNRYISLGPLYTLLKITIKPYSIGIGVGIGIKQCKTPITPIHRGKAKAKILCDVCRFFFDLFRFRYRSVRVGPAVKGSEHKFYSLTIATAQCEH